jgi:2-methylcitrate dehydratase PrpD
MGAAAAAASLAKLDEKRMRYALSYAAQQVSGIWSWVEDFSIAGSAPLPIAEGRK